MLLWPFNKYPGTDYETFNWEWILKTVKDWVATMQTFKNTITAAWDAMRADWRGFETSMTDDWQNYQNGLNDQWQDYQDGLNDQWKGYQDGLNDQWQDFIDDTYKDQITEILEDHPEWVTTVQDGAITKPKINAAFLQEIENAYVTPEMFGAVGDGVTDDTLAFKSMCAANNGETMVLSKTYLVKGDAIFSYIENANERTNMFVYGHDAVIIWDSLNTTNSLFKLNWKVNKIAISGFTIKCKNNHGYVFEYYGNTQNGVQAGAVSSHIYDIDMVAYESGNVYYPDYVFYVHGYGHCDKMLIEKCSFAYFENFYKGDNPEAVNNTFLDCSFFTDKTTAIYFSFTEMYDNFNVEKCSFSLYTEQTLLHTSYGTNPNNFYFNFSNNRYELFGSGSDFQLLNAAFGVITFTNENYTISGFATKTLKIDTKENAIANFNNCYFNKVSIKIGSITGTVLTYGKMHGYYKNCAFHQNPTITYESIISKKIVFVSCDFPKAKNISYCAYQEERSNSGTFAGNMYMQSFNSLVDYIFPPFYYVERIKVRRLRLAAATQELTVKINGTDYTVSVDAAAGSEAVIPFTGVITSISTDKNILFNIIAETSAEKVA